MSTTLREVLAEHVQVSGFDELGAWHPYACACGGFSGQSDDEHRAHVEAAILAHLADVLGSEDVREAVRSAVANTVCRCDDALGGIICADCDADAALTAVRAALGITTREESRR